MRVADRLLTIVVTATLTSAAWIVIGSVYLQAPRDAKSAARAGPPSPHSQAVGTAPASATTPRNGSPPGALTIPVAGVSPDKLSDNFNDMRGGHRHGALDIMAPRGTEVIAAAPGTVEKLFQSVPGGNTIYVRSPDRTTIYYYAHLDHYADGLKEGQRVERGHVIAAVGSTGDASAEAPHLHFEIMRTTPQAKWYDPATDVDPYPMLSGNKPG
jgi:murein DD-endopeptidase MepM/ murein hydrolase activator NlpD